MPARKPNSRASSVASTAQDVSHDVLLRLEQLESLIEIMEELNVETVEEARALVVVLHQQLDAEERRDSN